MNSISLRRFVQIPIRGLAKKIRIGFYQQYWQKYQLPEITFRELTGQPLAVTADPILDDICMPPYYKGNRYEPHDDFNPLMALAKYKQPQTILELGTAHGNTVANLCRILPNAHIITINAPVEEQSGNIVTYELKKDEIGRVYRQYGYDNQITQIYANTLHLELSGYFSAPTIDLAIIDACHDTDYVVNDFLKIMPFVRAKGIVLLHDTHPSMKRHLLGSYRACLYLRQKGYDIRHLAGTWWGVWLAN